MERGWQGSEARLHREARTSLAHEDVGGCRQDEARVGLVEGQRQVDRERKEARRQGQAEDDAHEDDIGQDEALFGEQMLLFRAQPRHAPA